MNKYHELFEKYVTEVGRAPHALTRVWVLGFSRKLQLRPPTVTHHLRELRLAGLVELSLLHEENRYTARKQAIEAVYQNLSAFLQGETTKEMA